MKKIFVSKGVIFYIAVLLASISFTPFYCVTAHASSPSLYSQAYTYGFTGTEQMIQGTTSASARSYYDGYTYEFISHAGVATSYGLQHIAAGGETFATPTAEWGSMDGTGGTAYSRWIDIWTFRGTGNGTGTIGVTLTGSTFALGEASANCSYFLFKQNDDGGLYQTVLLLHEEVGSNASSEGELTNSFTFDYNTPYKITSELGGAASAWLSHYGDGDGSAHLNFADSAILSSLILPEGTWLEAASGTVYPITITPPEPPTTTPEPTTMLLLVLGLMGLAGVRRKFKK